MFIVKVQGAENDEMVTLDHETPDGREITVFATREAAQEIAEQWTGGIVEEYSE
jgi:hypothetical protein